MQELADLGFLDPATRGLDLALRDARIYQENPSLTFHGHPLPPHWSRVINRPDPATPFENDGHGLISLALYKLWQRLPDRDAWLRAHWTDVKAAGDWIPWQFDHPELSGAKDGVLHTTGESAGRQRLLRLPRLHLHDLARSPRAHGRLHRPDAVRCAMARPRCKDARRHALPLPRHDPKYGSVWTLDYAGWPNKSTVLGPIILQADYTTYSAARRRSSSGKRADQAAYQRLIDTYKPLGFYGWAMGYGQGFVTQSALLLDRMNDATTMFDWTAKEIYDPRRAGSRVHRP